MASCPPTAFIGEFDAQEGPKISYAFELFGGKHTDGYRTVTQVLSFLAGEVILGGSVASGSLHPDCSEYMRSIASRVLMSNERREESIIFQDSGSPAVGGFSFCFPDILARGESRRFCVVFLHPSYRELVARWMTLSFFARVFIEEGMAVTNERHKQEYSEFGDLERRREEARRKPLRSLLTLLSLPAETEKETFQRLHCFFEAVLPLAFSPSSASGAHIDIDGDGSAAAALTAKKLLEERRTLAESCVEYIDLDGDVEAAGVVVPVFARGVILPETELVVKPLCAWLVEMAARADPKATSAMELLLWTLFSGNQIVVTGDSAKSCASLALGLSYALPPSLVKVHTFAEEYEMPYRSRILSFSDGFLAHTFATAGRGDARAQSRLLFAEAASDGVVHVRVADDQVVDVQDCDSVATAVAPRKTSTLINRIISLVREVVTCEGETPGLPSVAALRLLNAQIKQLVSEYVVRGRVYASLFHEQEVEANRRLISAPSPSVGDSVPARLRRLFSGGASAGTAAHAMPSTTVVQKHSTLETGTGAKRFSKERYIFSSSSPLDHDVLLFLGSAACES